MIRKATPNDAPAIRNLLEQLGYPQTEEFVRNKLSILLENPYDEVFVYQYESRVVGFITLHYSVQLAYEKDFCEIGYFVVDEDFRSHQIGNKLESYSSQRAKERNCGEMLVYSSLKRTDAHRFYERQGYEQIEKYFHKLI